MNIYLSGQWSRRDEIEGYAQILREHGLTTVSRWHEGEPMGNDAATNPSHWREWADADLNDIYKADTYIAFTEPQGTMSRGGRHVEWGFALAVVQGMKAGQCMVIGPCESQFYAMADDTYDSWADFAALLERLPTR